MRASNPIVPALAATLLSLLASGASAHPHVWVSVKAIVLYEKGAITGLQEAWTFDEFYTAQAIEGLDKNGDGKYDRQELAELAQVNIDGLKEFDYFTYAKLGKDDRKFKPPETTGLSIRTRASSPCTSRCRCSSRSPPMRGSSRSPSSTRATLSPSTSPRRIPVKLGAGAPAGCAAVVHDPLDDENSNAKKLNQAFSGVLGQGGTVSLGGDAKTVAVHCAKS